MKVFAPVLALAFCVAAGSALAQQSVTKPVLGANPAPGQVPTATPPSPATASPVPGGSTAAPGGLPGPTAAQDAMAGPVSAAPGSLEPSYTISPGDTILVTVWREPNLTGTFPVRPDGMISLSLLGDIPAAGFTPMALGADITARLKRYINEPSVTVTVTGVRPKEVYIIGEVLKVGPVTLTADMSVLQAISAAGGLTPYANGKKVYILRGEKGHQQKIPFDYKKAIKGDNGEGVSLIPGDTIVVP